MTALAVTTAAVDHALVDDPRVGLDALADAADRLTAANIEHHLADLPFVLPDGGTVALEQSPGNVVRGIADNGCWVMLYSLAQLPEYADLLRQASGQFELSVRARGETVVWHDLVAFIGAPGATVPVHFDRNHHLLMQVRGTKTVGTGSFSDRREQQRQIEQGMLPHRLNADAMPDRTEMHTLHAGEALVIPAYVFHWVRGGDDVSIALTCVAGTDVTARDAAVHRFNMRARRFGLRPAPPGSRARVDRLKERAMAIRPRSKRSHAPTQSVTSR
jgi:hypothetical protein